MESGVHCQAMLPGRWDAASAPKVSPIVHFWEVTEVQFKMATEKKLHGWKNLHLTIW